MIHQPVTSRNPRGGVKKRRNRFVAGLMLLAISAALPATPRVFTINVDDWARPRSGEGIVEFAELRDLAVVWSTLPAGAMIEIRYPGGDEGALWANELSDWLVSLGIASEHIRLQSGNARIDQIQLIIIEAGK